MTDEGSEFDGFEWDEAKNKANIAKHSISFADATRVFADPNFLASRSHRSGEARSIAIGLMHEQLVAVIYTHRGANIRIISARVARRTERDSYEESRRRTDR